MRKESGLLPSFPLKMPSKKDPKESLVETEVPAKREEDAHLARENKRRKMAAEGGQRQERQEEAG